MYSDGPAEEPLYETSDFSKDMLLLLYKLYTYNLFVIHALIQHLFLMIKKSAELVFTEWVAVWFKLFYL